MGIAGFVVGIALGPATQTCFQPIGSKGWFLGKLEFNMYTLPSYVIIAGAIFVIVLLEFIFVETHAGIVSKEDKEASKNAIAAI